MHYRLIIKSDARRKLKLLPKRARKEIGYRLFLMQEDLAGSDQEAEGRYERVSIARR
jgi:mRNA-degrading endonuclease RelE of RelBE toxin-antitoxin system